MSRGERPNSVVTHATLDGRFERKGIFGVGMRKFGLHSVADCDRKSVSRGPTEVISRESSRVVGLGK